MGCSTSPRSRDETVSCPPGGGKVGKKPISRDDERLPLTNSLVVAGPSCPSNCSRSHQRLIPPPWRAPPLSLAAASAIALATSSPAPSFRKLPARGVEDMGEPRNLRADLECALSTAPGVRFLRAGNAFGFILQHTVCLLNGALPRHEIV